MSSVVRAAGASSSRTFRTASGIAVAAVLAAGSVLSIGPVAQADPSTFNVVDRAATSGVTADALPTTQIDGVAWSQKVVGNTVFVGGEFTNARPAGTKPGTNLTARANLLAYDLTTGALVDGFTADTNAPVNVIAVSPDKSRIYIGGSFTTVAGQPRYRLAAINVANGSLVPGFAPTVDASVQAITVTETAVYVGGGFSVANGVARGKLAAFDPNTGALLNWAPKANNNVKAMTTTPDRSRIIVGGQFSTINGISAPGSVSLDAATGTMQPWAFNTVVKNSGTNASIFSLTNDGTNIIATAYAYTMAAFEGAALVEPMTGRVKWLADCHGDSYSAAASNKLVYVASHEHNCENIGSFGQVDNVFHRATAFTYDATSTVKANRRTGYSSFAGNPAPAQVTWFPELAPGTYTGQSQAAWSVEATDDYVVFGGEFPSVNGTAQQGLVRFAVPGKAPKKQGPLFGAAEMTPTAVVNGNIATLRWKTSHDRDNEALDYKVYRDDDKSRPIATVSGKSLFWDRPMLSYTDSTMVPGQTYTYWVWAVDADGNRIRSNNVTVTASAPSASTPYLAAVMADGPSHLWRLGESSGTQLADSIGGNPLVATTGVALGQPGVLTDNTAAAFNGTTGSMGTSTTEASSNNYTAELWMKTTTTTGGLLIGQGTSRSGSSGNYDRRLFMTNAGRIAFDMYSGTDRAITSPLSYNDGKWHHVAVSLSGAGMRLYVDGGLVASNATYTTAQTFTPYWRVGGDTLYGVIGKPTSGNFEGTIDEVAVYPTALSDASIRSHAKVGGSTVPNTPPKAAFTSSCTGATCTFDAGSSTDAEGGLTYAWEFGDGTTATGAKPSHTFATSGAKQVTLTVADDAGAINSVTQAVTVTVPNQAPKAAFGTDVQGLGVSVDATASTDADGTIAEYGWDFGDGTGGAGATAQHTYAAAGTYTITLTAVDDRGAKSTTTRTVTVLSSGTVVGQDDFSGTRTRWGSTEVGGPWTYETNGAAFSTDGSTGRITMTPGAMAGATLAKAAGTDTTATADVSVDKVPVGGGLNVMVAGRRTSAGEYRAKLRLLADGTARIGIARVQAGAETVLKEAVLPGGYTAGQTVHLQLKLVGTTVQATAWRGDAAPTNPSVSLVDTTPELQGAGSAGVTAYLSAAATNAPIVIGVDNLTVVSAR